MSGIVNSTGARSGLIGTTVGTPEAGGVLQVGSDNYNSQTETTLSWEDNVRVKCAQITLVTKQANSSFFYTACCTGGGQGDPDNWQIKITKTAGSTAVVSDNLASDNLAPGNTTQAVGENEKYKMQYFSDVQTNNQFQVQSINLSDLITSSHSLGTQFTFGLWISGGIYINRSENRANGDSGLTTLTIMEIGV